MTARRALLEDVDFDVDAGEFVAARRGLAESSELVTTAVLPKYEAERAFAKPVAKRATRRNRMMLGAGLAAVAALVPAVLPVHAEYAKAPKPVEITEYADVTMVDLQEIAAEDAAARAAQRREEAAEAQRQAEAEAQRQAEEEARRQAEEEEARRQAEAAEQERQRAAAQRTAQAQRAQDQTASRAAERPAAPQQQHAVAQPVYEGTGDASGAINFALAQTGKPYVWGGNGPNGYDCSGLVQASFRSIGVSLPRTSNAMAGSGRAVSVAEMQPGDIIISNGYGHVSIYIGNGQIVHASTFGVPVGTAPLSNAGPIDTVRRVV